MTNIVRRMFDSRSKEEKEQDYEVYSSQIFPYGNEQKNKISQILRETLPKNKVQYLLLHYILIKQEYLNGTGQTIEDSCKKIEKKKLIKITPQSQQVVRELLKIDLLITDELCYPSSSELIKIMEETSEGVVK